uniref:Aluminum-activated malate transporter n=1 Tax=Oryza glumipatula TaxID=40148 RepID=A0A0D9YXT4_9ORYZ
MGTLPVTMPPPQSPELRSLRSTLDQRGELRAPLLSFDWGFPGGIARWEGEEGRLRRAAGAARAAATEMWAFARKDPRKPVFAAKVATALALITLLVFLREPTDLANHAVWAILTVVVVFEFSIGATLSKGLNRGLGTLTAGGFALAVSELSSSMGNFGNVILIICTFVVAFGATLTKLHPKMKPYEYGFRVFLLTFCYVTVSGYNTGKFIATAISRFLLIAIGAAVSLALNIGIHPIWAGEDLHNLVAKNFDGVAKSLEGCVDGYLKCMEYERVPSTILTYQASDDDHLYSGCRAAVESSAQEEALLGFAIWEPPHGPYKMMKYPWMNYTKVGGALRHCSFSVMALHGCILSEIQAPPESRQVFSAELHRVGQEGAKVLRELGHRVKTMTRLSSQNILSEVHFAAEQLQKKIDQKSYLLVNTEKWQALIRRHGGGAKDGGLVPGRRAIASPGAVHKSSSFASSTSHSSLNSAPRTDASYKPQPPWPIRQPSFHPSLPFQAAAAEARTYESASALSLATFASLLIEFVARLRSLVDAFEELSESANFKEDPVEEPSAISRENGGVLYRLRRFFGLEELRQRAGEP